MKKIFLLAAVMVASMTVFAGRKTVISMGAFESAQSVSADVQEKVKQNVQSGLSAVNHLQLIESADGLGADYIITGNVLSYNVTRQVNDKGEVTYKTTMSYTLTSTDVKEGTTTTETFNYDGSGAFMSMKFGLSSSETESREEVYKFIAPDMKRFAYANYPLAGQIVEADYTLDKKGRLTECYITLGSEDGVDTKTKFTVLLGKMVAGRTTRQKADVKLEVVEIVAGDLSRCKVSGKEADKVAAALEAYASNPGTALPVTVNMLPPRDNAGWDQLFK